MYFCCTYVLFTKKMKIKAIPDRHYLIRISSKMSQKTVSFLCSWEYSLQGAALPLDPALLPSGYTGLLSSHLFTLLNM